MRRQIPRAGDRLGSYELLNPVGSGGAAVVHRARHVLSGSLAAIKILDPDAAPSPKTRSLFERESRILTRVRHSNVVRVLEAGCCGGHLYLALELVPGGSLRARLTRGPLVGEELYRSGDQLLAGVRAIHRQGILHRDLTPSNILLDEDRLVLGDFGLARFIGEETLTRSRGVLMSLAYATPERIRGLPQGVSSDLYQVGLVVFEMMTGRRVFDCSRASELATAHLSSPPPSIMDLGLELPDRVDRFLDRALRKEPGSRYQDAQSMREDWRFIMASHGARRRGRVP